MSFFFNTEMDIKEIGYESVYRSSEARDRRQSRVFVNKLSGSIKIRFLFLQLTDYQLSKNVGVVMDLH
jgi:hypothetical protein